MKKSVLSLLMLLVSAVGAQAKYWKIGPSSVAGMDFLVLALVGNRCDDACNDEQGKHGQDDFCSLLHDDLSFCC